MTEETLQRTAVGIFKEFYEPLIIESSWNGIDLSGIKDREEISKIIANFYQQGGLKGSSDLKVYLPDMKMIHIELKRPGRKGGQSPEQKKLEKKLKSIGHRYYLCNDLESIFNAINANLSLDYRTELVHKYRGEYSMKAVAHQLGVKDI